MNNSAKSTAGHRKGLFSPLTLDTAAVVGGILFLFSGCAAILALATSRDAPFFDACQGTDQQCLATCTDADLPRLTFGDLHRGAGATSRGWAGFWSTGQATGCATLRRQVVVLLACGISVPREAEELPESPSPQAELACQISARALAQRFEAAWAGSCGR